MITVNNLTKVFRTDEVETIALDSATFEIKEGEFVAIMGPSGCGKSTLMNILGLLDNPTEGSYTLFGQEMANLKEKERTQFRKGNIGFVFQSFNLLPRTSALENVIMPLSYTASDLTRKQCRQRGIEMLERVGLSDRIYHYPSQLSGGQQQRVAIARALVNHPPVLFADEPTGNLDSKTSEEVMEMFSDLNKEGITVILVTHSIEIAGFAKRAIHIQDGLVVDGGYDRKGGTI